MRAPLIAQLKRTHCLLCEQSCSRLQAICPACTEDLPWLLEQCQRCALPLPADALICAECLRQPPAFEHVQAPWRYAFPVDALINRFKHNAHWPIGRMLTDLTGQHLAHAFSQGLARPDALVPVPLGKLRLRQRGFNQALMLCQWLSKQLQLPVRNDLLWRRQDTTEQQSLDAKQRRRNLRQAFAMHSQASCQGLHLAVVDDVMTTGSTAHYISQLLLQAGAASVSVYCLARTPKPSDRN